MAHTKRIRGTDGTQLTLFFNGSSYFSNFYPCERLQINGINYSCTEQYYAHQKAEYFNDDEAAEKILRATHPHDMKRYGRRVRQFRLSKWHEVCIEVMATANMNKFIQNDDLRQELLKTAGTELVECNPNDPFWGIGLAIDDPKVAVRGKWRGKNWLGRILTKIRECLLEEFH
ncbi:hypothetical protein QR680_015035 [Steinernema hermaphroditum]|uniref:NADAR domain-containing protein n=1 Tax=Steinernema hermaphroditum TaxID=289476 RepID=A0AA39M4V6_9BILA|nr:hypothetical protein QR680_015035 [Steinernema hermaphroditum]